MIDCAWSGGKQVDHFLKQYAPDEVGQLHHDLCLLVVVEEPLLLHLEDVPLQKLEHSLVLDLAYVLWVTGNVADQAVLPLQHQSTGHSAVPNHLPPARVKYALSSQICTGSWSRVRRRLGEGRWFQAKGSPQTPWRRWKSSCSLRQSKIALWWMWRQLRRKLTRCWSRRSSSQQGAKGMLWMSITLFSQKRNSSGSITSSSSSPTSPSHDESTPCPSKILSRKDLSISALVGPSGALSRLKMRQLVISCPLTRVLLSRKRARSAKVDRTVSSEVDMPIFLFLRSSLAS